MYYLSIVCARQSIFIANPYFVPDQAGVDALVDAKRRGVDVRIMVSGVHNDNWLARQNSVRLYGPLLGAGIEILEFNQTMLHQKTMVVDALWATVGTTNFDNRSFAHNEENNVCVYDAAWSRRLHDIFLADAARCDRVTLEAWQQARRRGQGDRDRRLAAAGSDLTKKGPGSRATPARHPGSVRRPCAWSPGDTRTAARSRPAAT